MTTPGSPVEFIRNWVDELKQRNVARAVAVTNISLDDGVMRVRVEPERHFSEFAWNSVNADSRDSLAEFFAQEFGWTTKQAAYLRELVVTLGVVHKDGEVIDSVDITDYKRRKNPRVPFGQTD